MAGGTRSLCGTLNRKKRFTSSELQAGNLRRCLNRWDLSGLGVGSTLGLGTYVLLGYVAYNLAGPSVVLSFLIAAVAALFAGLCYAELGSRIPRAGSAYIYTYMTIGELAAFVVGWNNILEGLFSTASIAKGLSVYVDSMSNQSLSEWFTSVAPITAGFFSPYFDFLAFCAVLVVAALLAVGAKESSAVNNVVTVLNILVIVFVIIAGAVKADSANWYISALDVPEHHGSGGFFPYGMWGTLRGAAVCFYGFVGFDTITAAGEETREPRDNVPIAILITLVTVFFAYTSVAIVVTMMTPYYLQDSVSAVAGAFSQVGMDWAWWVVSLGTICGISASLYGALFPLPRLLYAMSSDGFFITFFSKLSWRKSPVIATIIPAAVIAVLSSVMALDQMVMMVCIGTLLSYTSAAACVLLLRYRSENAGDKSTCSTIFGCGLIAPSTTTSRVVIFSLLLFICVCVTSALVLLHASNPLIPVLVLHAAALILIFVMCCQPKIVEEFASKTPLVPLIPCLSIYVNIHLMTLINIQTWIRVFVWMLIGIPVYIICVCCKKKQNNLEENMKTFGHANKNGKTPVQILVQSPTPTGSRKMISDFGAFIENSEEMQEIKQPDMDEIYEEKDVIPTETYARTDEIIVQHAIVENNEEKEAKIIDLLDQVLQAEEDRYGEVIHLKEEEEDEAKETIGHRKSLSELSDAGSDASVGNQEISKYDVIAQVHREDLPIVSEEEERNGDKEDVGVQKIEMDDYEQVTAFNESETNSRTDESGYSDTILDRSGLNDSQESIKEDAPYIPPPPPIDEEYFSRPTLHKFYSMPKGKTKMTPPSVVPDDDEEIPPRESLQSNSSQGDGNIVFGSDRQINFMSKLSGIFANKLNSDDQEQRQRSHSTGNVVQGTELAVVSRPLIFKDLNKEFLEKKDKDLQLRPVKVENVKSTEIEESEAEEVEDLSMTRSDLKSRLETIFASGGTQLVKPRLMKSNPPTPEEAYQTESSSTDSLPKITKENKNDTLSRQKAKFGEVLNSFRLSFNSDDQV
ncbi:cationic amino acid transporter 2-like [Plodia interpunctella]|uniref:cationic amino acid transporter 2-like n=1 Tax=Plodia interpunctella TaxID=58824 RepID=UPI0023675B02|nr:cationic amino acid transporter 2-like [Plodia interpunctella]XP_053609487.1 cationic amino acid transporter 2-like [Plodia interpunctella]